MNDTEKAESMNEKYLLLKAENYNWGLLKAGRWRCVVWQVYSDRSYRITVEMIDFVPNIKTMNGKMSGARFERLQNAIKEKPWRAPDIDCFACDGVAWEINEYSESGEAVYSSGEIDYIYGHKNLERIAATLPSTGQEYGAGAYVSVRKRARNMEEKNERYQ